jgi:hypothetical protein
LGFWWDGLGSLDEPRLFCPKTGGERTSKLERRIREREKKYGKKYLKLILLNLLK